VNEEAKEQVVRTLGGGGRIGIVLLGIWLVLTGLTPHQNVSLERQDTLLDILAIVAGVLILVDR
jgi:hypothetical protein